MKALEKSTEELKDLADLGTRCAVGRKPIGPATAVRFGDALRDRIDRVLKPREKLAVFVRTAVTREVETREAEKPRPKRRK
jgi:hypothetical protein